MIRHRACTLRDTAYALIKAEMDTDFEEQCQEISRIRKIRKNKIAPIAAPLPLPEPVMPNITSSLDNKVWCHSWIIGLPFSLDLLSLFFIVGKWGSFQIGN